MSRKALSAQEKVLRHLKNRGSITTKSAKNQIGIDAASLRRKVYKLRQTGLEITTIPASQRQSAHAKYVLVA